MLKLEHYDRKVLRQGDSTLMPNPDPEDIPHPRVMNTEEVKALALPIDLNPD